MDEVMIKQDQAKLPFGFLAYLGAAASLVMCYATVLIGLTAPLLGFAAFEINPHIQAVLMWLFALVTVIGLAQDRRKHSQNLPLVIGAVALAIIVGTLYTYYHVLILVLGYILLVVAAFANQNIMLGRLNQNVQAQARQLGELNSTLEQRVERQVTEIERLARLKRFLSSEVADLITAEGKESLLDSHRRLVACLFCDVRNFTAFSEAVEPEEVMNVLQVVHEHMGRLVAEHGGTIAYRAGDGLMVIFNDPLPCDHPVLKALELALPMKTTFKQVREDWKKLGHDLGLGIGVSYGYATLGLIGSEGRYDYTAIGNVVNIAARLCDKAGEGEILVDKRAYVEIENKAQTKPVGFLDLKGLGKKVEAFKVVGLRPAASATG